MIPVDQTMFKPETGPGAGNCWQAAVASIFELNLDQVPNFMDGASNDEAFDRYVEWCRTQGFTVMSCKVPLIDAYGLCTGKSPRGDFNHAVVTFGEEIVHDPHPSRDGINGAAIEYDYFAALNPAAVKRGDR